jgi:L-asparaginase / beta-aspartyl-peptidase
MYALAIHGGAGELPARLLGADRERNYRAGLQAALDAGAAVLEGGGSSLDAVCAAVRVLEDDPLFNAGRGAALTRTGRAELDASIMCGRQLAAGAVASVRHVRNPVLLARCVMDRSDHVLMVGDGAEEFALEQGFELVPGEYFRTPARVRALERMLGGQHGSELLPPTGTVGAVALDSAGNLAAATSTGGTTGKRPGRVGDSPIIGAGTYARNGVCAVSATGHGEHFIRAAAAHDVCALMEYRGLPLAEAVAEVVHRKLFPVGGSGGLISVDAQGNVVMDFNSEGMFRAARASSGLDVVAIGRA